MPRPRKRPRKDEKYLYTPHVPNSQHTLTSGASAVDGWLKADGVADLAERERIILAIDYGEPYYSVGVPKQWWESIALKACDVKVILAEIAERINAGPRARCWFSKAASEILFSFGIEAGTTDAAGPSAEYIRALFLAHPDVKFVSVFQNLPERSIKPEYKRVV